MATGHGGGWSSPPGTVPPGPAGRTAALTRVQSVTPGRGRTAAGHDGCLCRRYGPASDPQCSRLMPAPSAPRAMAAVVPARAVLVGQQHRSCRRRCAPVVREACSSSSANRPCTRFIGGRRTAVGLRRSASAHRAGRIRLVAGGGVAPAEDQADHFEQLRPGVRPAQHGGRSKGTRASRSSSARRTMRWATVASCTRKRSAGGQFHTRRSVSATRASGDSTGWQAVKTRRSRSSPTRIGLRRQPPCRPRRRVSGRLLRARRSCATAALAGRGRLWPAVGPCAVQRRGHQPEAAGLIGCRRGQCSNAAWHCPGPPPSAAQVIASRRGGGYRMRADSRFPGGGQVWWTAERMRPPPGVRTAAAPLTRPSRTPPTGDRPGRPKPCWNMNPWSTGALDCGRASCHGLATSASTRHGCRSSAPAALPVA